MTAAYDAKQCTITWGGIALTGLAEDMVTGEKDEELFSTEVGAQGDVVVNTTNNGLGTVTVTLLPSSPQIPSLIADAKAGTVRPLWVTSPDLNQKFGGTEARIKNYPSMERSQEASDLEFEFQVFDYTVDKA